VYSVQAAPQLLRSGVREREREEREREGEREREEKTLLRRHFV